MKLNEIFDQLTFGELSQLSVGGSDAGAIKEENYPAIVASINLGLTALYKRFALKEGSLTLALQPGKLVYPLNRNFALSNTRSREAVRYIQDTDVPFIEDILKIERAYADSGVEFPINDIESQYSLSTPSATMLRVPAKIVAKDPDLPEVLKTDTLRLAYRANHPIIVIDAGFFDPTDVDIELPYSHLDPLLLFIAARLYNPLGMSPNTTVHTGNNYMAQYEASCRQLEVENLRIDQQSQPDRLTRNGWV